MSYILEALKKAERERAKGRVPRLTSVQLPDDEPRRRRVLWVGGAGVLAAGVLFLWLWAPWQPAATAPRPATVARERAAARSESTSPVPPAEMPESARRSPSRLASRGTTPAAPPQQETRPAPALRERVVPPAAALTPRPAEPTSPLPSAPVPPRAPAATEQNAPALAPPPPAQASAAEASRAPSLAPPPAATPPRASPSIPSLASAVARMALTTLVYSEDPAARLVYIDGRPYAEGQQVGGQYLLERITPEGAILTANGERILLPPTAAPLAR